MKNRKWELLIVGATLAIALFLAYYAVLKYHFVSPPGDDIYIHLHNATLVSQNGLPAFGTSYPPGLYAIVIAIARLFHVSLLQSFTYVAPALLPLGGISVWLLARRLFNPVSALISFALFELVTLQPLQTYFDGSLPNLFAAGILLPLFFLAVISWVDGKRRWLSAVFSFLLLAALLYSHHLTVLVALATLLLWGIISVLVLLFRTKSWPKIMSGLVLILIALVVFGFAFAHLEIFAPARNLFFIFAHFTTQFPFIVSTITVARETWDTTLFGISMGGLIFQGGVVGFFLLLGQNWRLQKADNFIKLLPAVWFFVYWVGSMHEWSGEPTRLARDLALPATVIGGWALYWIAITLWRYYRVLAYVFATLVLLLVWGGVYTRTQYETSNTAMVRFSQADDQAYQYIQSAGLASQTTILIKEFVWQEVAFSRGDTTAFAAIVPEQAYGLVPTSRCYLVGWYEAGVWPPSDADQIIAQTYLAAPTLIVRQHFSDSLKEWFLLCQK